MALLHLILWLIHAVVAALADVFTHLIAWLVLLLAAVAIAMGIATAFGIGGLGLARRRRKRNRQP